MIDQLIVSRGRVADRTSGALLGARLTANVLGTKLGLEPRAIGFPAAPTDDDWTISLPAAQSTLNDMSAAVSECLSRGERPLIVNNTCAVSLSTLPAAAKQFPDLAVLWVDAHGDFNTPATTASGYLGGMVLAGACGLWDSGHGHGVDPRRVILCGAHDLDAEERASIDNTGIRVVSPGEFSAKAIMERAGNAPLWIHIDWDVLEPGQIPAAYRVPGGIRAAQIKALLQAIPADRIVGIEVAEFEATGAAPEDGPVLDLILDTLEPLLLRTSFGRSRSR